MGEPLKPCPFCLAKPVEDSGGVEVHPEGRCYLAGFEIAPNYEDAEIWNRRASPWRPWSELDPEEHGRVLWRRGPLVDVVRFVPVCGWLTKWNAPVGPQPDDLWMPIPPSPEEAP